MNARKTLNVIVSLMVLTTLFFGGSRPATAMPMDPTDESKVPHYFGPNPNWANSPFTLPDAQVVITGNGTGAMAEATIGANGSITAIIVTKGGRGYSNARIDILGPGSGARARATIVRRGSVVEVTVNTPGTGYTAPTVSFSGGGPGSGAAATAYGGVEQITLTNTGGGYTMPTVDFDMPNDPDGVQAQAHVEWDQATGVITAVVVDNPGSGYSSAPGVTIRNGTIFAPLPLKEGGQLATATSTLFIDEIVLDSFGANYNQTPSVTISDPTGTGATATAFTDDGVITAITVDNPGSGYLTPGIRKFVDTLPGLGEGAANNLGQYIPVAVPDTTSFENADYYEIAVVEYQEQMHSDLPPTRLRGYVQLETSKIQGKHIALPGGKFGVDEPHYLGPTIIAQKDRAVRITFYNLLPTGAGGDFFLPTDSTIMGSGMGPMEMTEPTDQGSVIDMVRNPDCSEYPKGAHCFKDNRATLHLHGGNSPWISDGTPHQWVTPAGEDTMWPEGVSVVDVPDMIGPAAQAAGVPDCSGENDGCMTFYYTNQQSARLMFYHDHSWGITRLNVYAGEAAGYVITDETEQRLIDTGTIPADMIPLVIQDRTFVPQDSQLYNQYDAAGNVVSYGQDPTWDKSRWGDYGDLWYHHVYMPAQNPGAPGGMSAFGRWMYSPWFWPPQNAKYDPIPNPYYDPACNLDDPATWQYQEDPFCEPQLIPGTPLISVGMEQFNDTPIVNGTAYPTVTLEPKSYRLRILNAANDRFFNFQWYVADPTTASTQLNALGQPIGGTEVALNAAEVAAAQLDPVVFPTPDLSRSPAGPDWIVFGSEGGFLPKPVVVDGQQVTTWIEDPTRFDAGLVDQHSLLLAPAERADVVVDFSRFAGKTLILYNDAPAAFPARIPSYDYYTGAPDLRPVGAPPILPGYGPNTRTIMQVKIAGTAAPAFNLSRLQSAFSHRADGSGVFESGQHPIIVGQAAYNSAYGSNFASSGWCNAPSNPSSRCDGFARINEQGGDMFKFDTLSGNQVSVKIEPKAIQDETSESNFDEFGRMSAVLGVEVVPATPGFANTVLYGYAFPVVDMFDTSDLPTADMEVTPISAGDDGTQIWKITHNGVDTHPIHFHAYDVQILNRVTWDNIIKPPHPTELGWKETFRVSPLEDTYFAMRPVLPVLPFDFPNSIRTLSPMMPEGAWLANSTQAELLGLPIIGFAPNGEPIDIPNHYINFGAEFVYHCHILSHEEMDMMHAVSLTLRPVKPDGLTLNGSLLSWTDNSLSETRFVIEKSTDGGVSWTEIGAVEQLPKNAKGDVIVMDPMMGPPPNTTGDTLSFDVGAWAEGDQFRVVAQNVVGDTHDYSDPNLNEIQPGTYAFPVFTAQSISEVLSTAAPPAAPAAPSNLLATPEAGPQVSLAWTDNATDETGFVIERSVNGAAFFVLANVGADTAGYVDATVLAGNSYDYRVAAVNLGGSSAYATLAAPVTIPGPQAPAAPEELEANFEDTPLVHLQWTSNSTDETGFAIQRSTDGVMFTDLATVGAGVTTYDDLAVTGGVTYTYQVAAFNDHGTSAFAVSGPVLVPADATPPAAPSNLAASNITATTLTLTWQDNSNNEAGFTLQRATNSSFTSNLVQFDLGPDVTSLEDTGLRRNTRYYYRILAYNLFNDGLGPFPWSAILNVRTANR
ncbi:MAG TPA: fibronectin type III domain-containing protein [Anaerolineales bacterium]|nr:fibronectin type III domain-containing protein [Anaerolineales bacterium]